MIDSYHFSVDNKICKVLHLTNNNLQTKIIKNLLDKKFCKQIIDEAEAYAKINGWSRKRHDNYPTVDNLVTPEWKISVPFLLTMIKKVYPNIIKMFDLSNKKDIYIKEIFVVKYDVDGQKSLEYHTDGSEFSFVIALNDEFEGGGTTFKHSGEQVKLGVGDCLLFSGKNKHKGNEITKGTRYILTGFLNYKDTSLCDNLIFNYHMKRLFLIGFDVIFIMCYILIHFEYIQLK